MLRVRAVEGVLILSLGTFLLADIRFRGERSFLFAKIIRVSKVPFALILVQVYQDQKSNDEIIDQNYENHGGKHERQKTLSFTKLPQECTRKN